MCTGFAEKKNRQILTLFFLIDARILVTDSEVEKEIKTIILVKENLESENSNAPR